MTRVFCDFRVFGTLGGDTGGHPCTQATKERTRRSYTPSGAFLCSTCQLSGHFELSSCILQDCSSGPDAASQADEESCLGKRPKAMTIPQAVITAQLVTAGQGCLGETSVAVFSYRTTSVPIMAVNPGLVRATRSMMPLVLC